MSYSIRWALSIIGFLWCGGSALAQLQLAIETPKYVKHAVAVSPDQFTEVRLTEMAGDFAARFHAIPFAVLYVSNSPSRLAYYMGKPATEIGPAEWKQRLEASIKEGWEPLGDIAEMNSIFGDAVLRLRIAGKVSRRVLRGRDPLIREEGERRYEILEIQGVPDSVESRRGATTIRCVDCVRSLEIFVRTGSPLSLAGSRRFGSELTKLSPGTDIRLRIRADAWFAGYLRFPMLYAFDSVQTPIPSPAELEKAPWIAVEIDGRTGDTRTYGSYTEHVK